ncbi:endonuclease/exonuclease/phosphatase family protein [Candidatus Gottesmanbacteria bacterium]|nr:endonuclease/exonuclease/phosphatase family protein [Candidatus Gottesmanbacteria bacterium]
MNIRLLQLNIKRGAYLPRVIDYIRAGQFDLVCLQEVAGGNLGEKGKNCYNEILKDTGYEGNLSVYYGVKGDLGTYIGIGTFWKNGFSFVSSQTVWLKKYRELPRKTETDYRAVPRCALCVLLEKSGEKVLVVNTHLAWGPTPNDALYKKNQAEKLYQWVRAHREAPFILAGDFNLNPHTKIVTRISQLGTNLTTRYHITNTLNPRTHYAKNLFPSGLPVDYIVTDKRITVKKFFIEDGVDLSDHFGLVLECTI